MHITLGLCVIASRLVHGVPFSTGQSGSNSLCSWGEWCSFSDCDAPCGVVATQVRSRDCECPEGQTGECGPMSDMFEEVECTGPCPECDICETDPDACPDKCKSICNFEDCVDPSNPKCPKGCRGVHTCKHTDWSPWKECPNICGNPPDSVNERSRQCMCTDGLEHPDMCDDASEEAQPCPSEPCCSVGEWSDFGGCPDCKDEGDEPQKTRSRDCDCIDGSTCEEILEESEPCSADESPPCVTCSWSGWCDWEECSASCDGGTQERSRKCGCSDGTEGDSCEGDSTESQPCNEQDCPPQCNWSGWCPWSDCSAECDSTGTQERSRECWCEDDIPRPGQPDGCPGEATQDQPCDGEECPKICDWAGWCAWGDCNASCSDEDNIPIRERERKCKCTKGEDVVDPEDGDCEGDNKEAEECPDVPACEPPRECAWAGWCEWGECSATCGVESVRERSRKCRCLSEIDGENTEVMPRDGDCEGVGVEQESCDMEECPPTLDPACVWSPWCPWSSCSSECDGIRSRTRKCPDECPTECPGSFEEKESCNTDCLVGGDPGDGCDPNGNDCVDSSGDDGNNSGVDKDGDPEGGNGNPNGTSGNNSTETNEGMDGNGDGTGGDIDVPVTDFPNGLTTPKNCWSNWSDWSECPAADAECPCGGCGTTTRDRKCLCGADPECPGCDGAPSQEEESCVGSQAECSLSEWSEWTSCDDTCGANAERTRNRECECPEGTLDGCSNGCDDNLCETEPCGDKTPICCNWTEWCGWSECSAECDTGLHTRSRECLCIDNQDVSTHSETECGAPSPNFENEICNTQSCDGSQDQDNCDEICENNQDCLNDCNKNNCEKLCGDNQDCKDTCTDDHLNNDECVLGEWSDWGECHGECDDSGVQTRNRDCNCPPGSTDSCDDLNMEQQECDVTCAPDSGGSGDDDCDDEECNLPTNQTPQNGPEICDGDCVLPEDEDPIVDVPASECCEEPECGECPEKPEATVTPAANPGGSGEEPEECIDDCPEAEEVDCPPEDCPEGDCVTEEPAVVDEPDCPECATPTAIATEAFVTEEDVTPPATTPSGAGDCPPDDTTCAPEPECNDETCPPATELSPTDDGCDPSDPTTCPPEPDCGDDPSTCAPVTDDGCRGDSCEPVGSGDAPLGSGGDDGCVDDACEPECLDQDCVTIEPECVGDGCDEFIPTQTPATVEPVTTVKPNTCLCPDEQCDPNVSPCPPKCENDECEDPCEPTDSNGCDENGCPESTCSWGDWCSWSDCTKDCGGRKIRSRTCECPDDYSGEPDCVGNMFDFADCDPCEVPKPDTADCESGACLPFGN